MDFQPLHDWSQNPNEAVKLQYELQPHVNVSKSIGTPQLVTAVDTAYNNKTNRLYAAAVTLKCPDMTNYERVIAEAEAKFPYIPALLAFREGPVILKALGRLKTRPDVVIYPGHGLAHPRGIGMASHLGLITGIPSIGCARRCLAGDYRRPAQEKGGCSSLFISDVESGFVYRTKENVKPIFISPGHMCTIRDALDIIIECLTDYRMPEPLRLAHLFANKYKHSAEKKAMQRQITAGHETG